MTLAYEDLLTNFEESINDTQMFLGLNPEQLSSRHTRQETRSLPDIVENYDHLKAAFQDTDYSSYFPDRQS